MKNYIKKIEYPVLYLYYSILYIFVPKFKFNFMNDDYLINEIINNKKSICRFGDGEFKWIMDVKQNSFQNQSSELQKLLYDVLNDYKDNEKCIISINKPLNDISKYTLRAKGYWKKFIVKYHKKMKMIIPDNYLYGDANITRPYMDYKDKTYEVINNRFNLLKKIWNDRDVIVIEGCNTKLGIGNDLFVNCKSLKRIICPSKNAFNSYNEIKKCIQKIGKDKLYLISLGPTATILAYEMSMNGYQCIDSGHIDIEYMWFNNKSKKKEKIDGKYVNELSIQERDLIHNIEEDEYLDSILYRIE